MVRLTGLDKLSYAELLDVRDQIDALLADRKALELRETKAKLREVAEMAGFTVEELFGSSRKKGNGAVKYRDPKAPENTWSGRGRKPNWLVAALNKGAKLETFAVG